MLVKGNTNNNQCWLCYCNFSLDGINPPIQPKTDINKLIILNDKKIIVNYDHNIIDIVLLDNKTYNFRFELYDIMGRKLIDERIEQTTNNGKYQIFVNNITNGLYFYKIIQNNKLFIDKILIYN